MLQATWYCYEINPFWLTLYEVVSITEEGYTLLKRLHHIALCVPYIIYLSKQKACRLPNFVLTVLKRNFSPCVHFQQYCLDNVKNIHVFPFIFTWSTYLYTRIISCTHTHMLVCVSVNDANPSWTCEFRIIFHLLIILG